MSSPSFLDRALHRSRSLLAEERGDVPQVMCQAHVS